MTDRAFLADVLSHQSEFDQTVLLLNGLRIYLLFWIKVTFAKQKRNYKDILHINGIQHTKGNAYTYYMYILPTLNGCIDGHHQFVNEAYQMCT